MEDQRDHFIRKISSRSIEHIRHLSETIGPRPPGSITEQQALDYASSRLRDAGLQPRQFPFTFRNMGFLPWTTAAGLLFILCALLDRPPLLTITLPLALAIVPDLGRWSVRASHGFERSGNVYACLGPETPPDLILCAHIDSAKAAVLDSPFLLWLREHTFFIAQRAAMLLTLLALVELSGLELFSPLPGLLSLLALLTGVYLAGSECIEQLTSKNRFSPGANDNASGAGLVLALAEHFSNSAVPNTDTQIPSKTLIGLNIEFLLTGAEEAGMHGARAFAKSNPPEPFILSIDMIGSGSRLRYASRDGVLRRLPANSELNSLIQQAHPHAEPLWYSLRSGDFSPFLEAGFPASGIQLTGNPSADRRYHSLKDTFDGIEMHSLEIAADTILELTTLLQQKKKNAL